MIAPAIHPIGTVLGENRLRAFTEADVLPYRDLLESLPVDDVRLRFHSVTAPSEPATIRAALLGPSALGAVLVESLAGELRGVAHAAPGDQERRGEFGVLVVAAHRRRGLGGAMADALIAGMAARGIAHAEAYTAWENRAAAALLLSRGFRGEHVGGGVIRWLR